MAGDPFWNRRTVYLLTVQFAKITSRTFMEAFMLAVVPYIVKDVASIAVAYGLSIPIRKVMNLEGVPVKKSAN